MLNARWYGRCTNSKRPGKSKYTLERLRLYFSERDVPDLSATLISHLGRSTLDEWLFCVHPPSNDSVQESAEGVVRGGGWAVMCI